MLIGVTRPTLVIPADPRYFYLKNKMKKITKITFFPCDAYLRRWISPLVPTALFSIIFKHPTRNQFSKTSESSFKKEEKRNKFDLPTLFFFNITPIKPNFFRAHILFCNQYRLIRADTP